MITIKLSEAEAELCAQNIDGWLDAGAGEGGLEPDEKEALRKLYDQCTSTKKTRGTKAAPTQGADGYTRFPDVLTEEGQKLLSYSAQGADARPVAITDEVLYKLWALALDSTEHEFKASAPALLATRDAAPSDAPKEDAKRLKQLEHALVYVAHSMHSEPQYMLAEGITLGDVSFVMVKVADIDVSVDLPESVARAMYDAAMQATATKDEERRIAIAAIAPRDKT